ncbi:uncharacterized protein LOC126575147 [Anopheles aquasalis]|uniref:uncharacterized protein LOC126575147 n=1 Tax=Anopheles aquasalis TaxID=42839 RepID=UPI00215ABD5F|nr:uncharacterized protein LOC126575147 [Anopheles aquasalis]
MKQLRSLELLPCFYHYNLENPIILRSNSVNHLKATTTIKIRVEMPKLQSFEGSLSSLDRPDENPASLTLSELKHLILCDESDLISITTVQSIFQRLTNLETIKLDYDSFDDEFFDVLCDNCTSLRELTISPNDSGPQNDCSMIRLDLTKLTKLTKLALENSLLDTVNLPKSIRKLKICLSFYNQHEMIQTLIDSSKSLEELQVVFFKAYEETVSLLETLSVLQRLEVLVFYGARFEESSFLHINAPLERVRQLRFVGCKLSTKSFLGIQEKFPNLKKLQFISC